MPPELDRLVPVLTARTASRQKNGALTTTVSCNEVCTVLVSGTVNVPGQSKVYRLKSRSRSLKAGERVRIRLRFSKRVRRAVRRALRKGKRVRGTLRIRATDTAGNRSTSTKRVRVVR
jgi:hypothetical protein